MSDAILDRLKSALASRYTIERELGRGGMATVYLAEDLKHHRHVAIKVLDPELARALGSERFLREVEVTAKLTHPHILTLIDSGEADGFLYYVMPYIEGETLRERMNREGQLPLDDALQITKEVAAALSYAHSHDVIHRDIKPENVLLSAGEAVVADFGIARAITEAGGEHLTETGISIGTPAYMSPEQASGAQKLDGRSDVYSLGCVLYEMLAGEPPYTGPTAQAVLAKKLSEATPRVSVVRERVPPSVEAAIDQALAKAPADRFVTAEQFVAAITMSLAHDSLLPVGLLRRPRRRIAVVFVLVPLAVAGAWIGWRVSVDRLVAITPSVGRQITFDPTVVEIEPALSPDGTEVAYTFASQGKWTIRVRDVEGGRPIDVAADLSNDCHSPRWTPDGLHIVVSLRGTDQSRLLPRKGGPARPGPPGRVWSTYGGRFAYQRRDSLFVGEASGAEETLVHARHELHSAAWSPDGRWLAFVVGNQWSVTFEWGNIAPSTLWLADLERGTSQPVAEGGLNSSPVWFPDSRSLLFLSDRDGHRDLYVLRVSGDGTPRKRPERLTTGLNAHSVSLSENGMRAAYSQLAHSQNILALPIPSTGTVSLDDARQVTSGNQIVENRGVSSDGSLMVFDSDRSGNHDIYVVSVDGGEPQQLTNDPAGDFAPQFSPDGREITFMSTRFGTRDIFVMNADGTGVVRVSAMDPGEELFPAFAPDGLQIVFALYSENAPVQLYEVRRTSPGEPWSTPVPLGLDGNRPTWSPDGRVLAYNQAGITTFQDGAEQIVVSNTDTHLRSIVRPSWSTDGRTLYFCASDSLGWGVFAIQLDGRGLRPIIRKDDSTEIYECGVAATGQFFLTVGAFDSDVYVMDLILQ